MEGLDSNTLKKLNALSATSVTTLPDDTLINILFNLNIKELEYLCSVNKRLNFLCTPKLRNSILVGDWISFIVIALADSRDNTVKKLTDYSDEISQDIKDDGSFYTYIRFAKVFLVTMCYGLENPIPESRLKSDEYIDLIATFLSYLSDTKTRKYFRILNDLGIKEDDIKEQLNKGTLVSYIRSLFLKNTDRTLKAKFVSTIDFFGKSTKFYGIYSNTWNGVLFRCVNKKLNISDPIYTDSSITYCSLSNVLPIAETYKNNQFAVLSEQKKAFVLESLGEITEIDAGGRSVNPLGAEQNIFNMKFNELLLMSQFLTLETIGSDRIGNTSTREATLVGIRSHDINGETRPAAKYPSKVKHPVTYITINDEKLKITDAINDSNKKYLKNIIQSLKFELVITSNSLSKQLREKANENLKQSLNDIEGVNDDNLSLSDFEQKITSNVNRDYITFERLDNSLLKDNNHASIWDCYLKVEDTAIKVKKANMPSIDYAHATCQIFGNKLGSNSEKIRIGIADITILETLEGEHYEDNDPFLRKHMFSEAVISNVKIEASMLLGLPFNKKILDQLVDSKERDRVYYNRDKLRERGNYKFKIKSIYKIKDSHEDPHLTLEQIKIEGNKSYILYDNKSNGVYCHHLHENPELIKNHIEKCEKQCRLCPKCCE
jgi:hypothetical protein